MKTINNPQETNRSLRVVLVSNNPITYTGLRMILGSHPNISLVGEVSGHLHTLPLIGEEKPDVILIDMDLTGVNVINLIRRFHDTATDSHILLLCGLNDGLTREALCSGAAGVVLKIQPPGVIWAAIEGLCDLTTKTLLPQATPTASSVVRRPIQSVKMKDNPETAKILTSLTNREREITALIGEGFSNKDIADRLCISETTVRHHLTSIFSKFDVSNRQKLLIAAHESGIVELKRSLLA